MPSFDSSFGLLLEAFLRHLRVAIRSLARTPGFTLTVILTLGLAIGANSVVFTALDAVLLRPLAFPEADRLVRVRQTLEGSAEDNVAPVRIEDWNESNSTFQAIAGYYTEDVSDTSGDLPERVRRAIVGRRFFEVWGVSPAIGRVFDAGDHEPGAEFVVVVSDRYWRNRMSADPGVLGRTIRLDGQSYPVIGVMPASFRFQDRQVDIWFPQQYYDFVLDRTNVWFEGVGRLRGDVTVDAARADLRVVQARLAEEFPDPDRKIGVRIAPLQETLVAGVRGSLWLLAGGVAVLLLIASANIAALLLVRAARRRREVAVRFSLGASRSAVVGPLLAEAGVLSLCGAALGLVVAMTAPAMFRVLVPDLVRVDEIRVGSGVVGFTLATGVFVTLICGTLPALRSLRKGLADSGGSRYQVSSGNRLQWALVGVQVALSVTLLTGAGLLVRSWQELSQVDPGFETEHVLGFYVSANWGETADPGAVVQRIERTVDALRTLPGVEEVAVAAQPVPSWFEIAYELIEGRSELDPPIVAQPRVVSPTYFATLGIPLVSGEMCRQTPLDAPVREVMVNRRFAETYLADRSPTGLHVQDTSSNVSGPPGRIVGIVGDARERGFDRDPAPTVYWCFYNAYPFPMYLVRSRQNPEALAPSVRLRMKEIEPDRAVYDMAALEDRIDDTFAENRLRTLLLGLFATTALLLACLGVYGTLSYSLSLRRREVGLRLALGAVRGDIVQQFVAHSLWVVGGAVAAGLGLAFLLSRLLTGMLYGVSPSDPATLSVVVAVVVAVATVAALVPATRASRLEPSTVLREE